MSYVDGFVIPVPQRNKDAYLAMARKAAPIFLEHGATRVVARSLHELLTQSD